MFVSFLAMSILLLVHLFAGKLRFLSGLPRSRWLSAAGGVAVAYVFVHLLPELNEAQDTIAKATGDILIFLERHVYLMALAGLVIFYGLERMVVKSGRYRNKPEETPDRGIFWVHIISFAFYNGLIGYLLLYEEDRDMEELILFTVAMGLHFIVNDYALRKHHKEMYRSTGRWVLSGAVLAGWCMGIFVEVSEVVPAILLAFLSGGIILNVLKEELPEERESRFTAFILGTAAYTVLLLSF